MAETGRGMEGRLEAWPAGRAARKAGLFGARSVRHGGKAFLALAAAAALAGCSIGIPDPAASPITSSAPALATPTITPGHDAAAVAAQDMPFAAGGTLAEGSPVQLSDGLREAPGWKPVTENVAGASEYVKDDGCLASAKVRTNQSALAVAGDDKASTEALFQYLDASILPAYLQPGTLRWGGEPGAPAPAVEVLVFTGGDQAGARATAVYARLFSTSGSSIYLSVSCPDAATLAAARADAEAWTAVIPPSA
ncbi:hypothetical protein ACTWQD_04670 [Pseudarthrobacter sp. 1C304]